MGSMVLGNNGKGQSRRAPKAFVRFFFFAKMLGGALRVCRLKIWNLFKTTGSLSVKFGARAKQICLERLSISGWVNQ